MADDLPEPLTPHDCDVSDTEPPREMLVHLMMLTFGVGKERAEAEVDACLEEIRAARMREAH